MTCVLCLFANPPGVHRCLRCNRATALPALLTDDDTGTVSFDPVFQLALDDGSMGYQPTELFGTLDFALDSTPADGMPLG